MVMVRDGKQRRRRKLVGRDGRIWGTMVDNGIATYTVNCLGAVLVKRFVKGDGILVENQVATYM